MTKIGRSIAVVALAACLLAAAAQAVWAIATLTHDAYTSINEPTTPHNGADLYVGASNFTSCAATEIAYLRFNLATLQPGTIDTVKLRLNGTFAAGTMTMGLYSVSDDTWTESDVTWNTQPARGSLLATATNGTGTIEFTSTDLKDYITAEHAGDNQASLAIQVQSCSTSGGILQRFDSKDGSGTSPNLIVLGPTAVTLSRLEASSGARALPFADNTLWIIGAAIAMGILLGQCLRRKRAIRFGP